MSLLEQPISSRKLAAILAADIAGYSALMGGDEEATVRKLRRVQDAVLPLIERFGGRTIDTAGDGVLAEFPSAVRAVEGAAAIQTRMEALNAEHDPPMLFRIGVNVGDVIYDGQRLYGDGINIAARLQAIAEPGGICISNKVYEEVRDKVGLCFRDIGEQKLKNIARPIRAFSVLGIAATVPAATPPGKKRWPTALPKRLDAWAAAIACIGVVGYLGSGGWNVWKTPSKDPNRQAHTVEAPQSVASPLVEAFNSANSVVTKAAPNPVAAASVASKPVEAAPSPQLARTETGAAEHTIGPNPAPGYSAADVARTELLDRLIDRDPNDRSALLERGSLRIQHREFALALADFERLLRLNPEDLLARNNRCWTRALMNQLAEALADCNEVLRRDPNFVDALDSRGFVHLKRGELRAAIADYTTALKLDAKHSSALYGRGLARARLGETLQSQQDIADAKAMNSEIDRDYNKYGL
jgi:class 3 adenylate cyclase